MAGNAQKLIRSFSISFAKRKCNVRKKIKKKLQKQINFEYVKAVKYADYDLSHVLRSENELDSIIQTEINGAIIRSKIKSFENRDIIKKTYQPSSRKMGASLIQVMIS